MRQIVTILALLLVACNPKLQQPTVVVPQKYLYGGYGDSITLEKEWWKIFRDTTLNRLIEIALQSNYDLKSAVSKIEEAKANMKVVRSQFLPSFDFGRSATVSGDGNGDISYSCLSHVLN